MRLALLNGYTVDALCFSHGHNGLVAPHKAGAGKDNRLEQVPALADFSDAGQVWPDPAALVADGVTRQTGGLAAVEDPLAAHDIALRQSCEQSVEPCSLFLQPCHSPLDQRIQGDTHIWRVAFDRRLEDVGAQIGQPRCLRQTVEQVDPDFSIVRLTECLYDPRQFHRTDLGQQAGQTHELGFVERHSGQHPRGRRPRSYRLVWQDLTPSQFEERRLERFERLSSGIQRPNSQAGINVFVAGNRKHCLIQTRQGLFRTRQAAHSLQTGIASLLMAERVGDGISPVERHLFNGRVRHCCQCGRLCSRGSIAQHSSGQQRLNGFVTGEIAQLLEQFLAS